MPGKGIVKGREGPSLLDLLQHWGRREERIRPEKRKRFREKKKKIIGGRLPRESSRLISSKLLHRLIWGKEDGEGAPLRLR